MENTEIQLDPEGIDSNRSAETSKRLLNRQKYEKIPHDAMITVKLSELRIEDNARADIIKDDDYHCLMESIKECGLLMPIIVEHREGELWLVSGHRRREAMIDIGENRGKAIFKKFGQKGYSKKIAAQLAENINRRDLNALDVGECYKKLISLGKYDIKDLVSIYNRDEQYIKRYIKLASWPAKAKSMLREQERIGKPVAIRRLHPILGKSLNSAEIIKEVGNLVYPGKPTNKNTDSKEKEVKSSDSSSSVEKKVSLPRTSKGWLTRIEKYMERKRYTDSELKIIKKFVSGIGIGKL